MSALPHHWRTRAGSPLAPLLVGLAYALARHLPQGLALDDLYWQSPFVFTFLSGVLLALACRPLVVRLPWTRPAAAAVVLAVLLGTGAPANWVLGRAVEAAGLAAMPFAWVDAGPALMLACVVAAALMAWLLRDRDGTVALRGLWGRFRQRRPWLALGGVGAAVVALWLALGALDAHLEASSERLYVPLLDLNPWLRMEAHWLQGAAAWAVPAWLLLLWLRALALLLPLLPVALLVRARWHQLFLLYALLLFVVGEFVPLMGDQPYFSARWLTLRLLLSVGEALAVGAVLAWAVRPEPPRG